MSLFDDASLVLIPDGAKDGTLYSVKPTDGTGDFTFTRGSNLAATRVDENGLIEKGRENLITYSNDFTQWNQQNVNVTTNAVQNPFNTGTTQTITEQVNTSTQYRGYTNSYTTSSGIVYAHSVYVKRLSGTRDFAIIDVNGGARVYFDMTNILVGTEVVGKGKIEDVGNGWYRLSVYGVATGNSAFYLALTNGTSGGSETYTSDGSGSYALYGAQLEVGLVATDYIETGATTAQAGILEDLPRIDYSGGASCPALLLEPQRSNFVTRSEYFGDADWNTATSRSYNLTYTNELNPMGIAGSYQYESTDTDNQLAYVNFGVVSGNTYTNSVYVKRVSGTGNVFLRDVNNGSTSFSLSVADGWKRIDVTATASSTTGRLYLNLSVVGDEILIWGAQQEEGSYPTSYIPTYGSSVTRSADSCNNAGNSSTFNDSEGVLYAEIAALANDGTERVISLNSGSFNNRVQIYYTTVSNQIVAIVQSDNVIYFNVSTILSDTLQINKIAIKYKQNDFALWVNGIEIAADISGNTPIGLNNLDFSISNVANFYGKTKQILYFPTALTDSELSALTRPYNTYQEWVDGEGLTWESKSCTNQSILELQNL